MENWRGIVELRASDLVVKVRSGETVSGLNGLLRDSGLCLPYRGDGPIGPLLDANLPHTLEAQHGSWRDWVLGMTVVLADGSLAKSGAMVVKSVAGYDVHKLMIGAHGRLGWIAEVTLRLIPNATLADSAEEAGTDPHFGWIQRVLPADWPEATRATPGFHRRDPASRTIWHSCEAPPVRFAGDWLMRADGTSADPDPHPDLTERALSLLGMPAGFQVV